jgi:phosphotransferase system enzyme I (PtsI)
VVDSAHANGISVGVCGEMAGEPEHAFIFLGMGLDQLSMNSFSLLRVKRLIRSVSFSEAREISEKVLDFSTAREVENLVASRLSSFYKDEFWH